MSSGKRNRNQMPELCLTARRLVEAGVRYVTIGRNSWDHHSNIFPQIKSRVPRFDHAFAGLITDLEQRGLLDETLIVYLTEFGRTPKVNSQAGRDHWPRVFSVAFAGAGIQTWASDRRFRQSWRRASRASCFAGRDFRDDSQPRRRESAHCRAKNRRPPRHVR